MRSMTCPTCHAAFERNETQFPPFCCERCKLIDLGKWLDGAYRLPGEPADVPENAESDGESFD